MQISQKDGSNTDLRIQYTPQKMHRIQYRYRLITNCDSRQYVNAHNDKRHNSICTSTNGQIDFPKATSLIDRWLMSSSLQAGHASSRTRCS